VSASVLRNADDMKRMLQDAVRESSDAVKGDATASTTSSLLGKVSASQLLSNSFDDSAKAKRTSGVAPSVLSQIFSGACANSTSLSSAGKSSANDRARAHVDCSIVVASSQSIVARCIAQVADISCPLADAQNGGQRKANAAVGTYKLKPPSEFKKGHEILAWLTRVREFCAGPGVADPDTIAGLMMSSLSRRCPFSVVEDELRSRTLS
jgi:hypothetical protein